WHDQAGPPADWELTSDSLTLGELPGNWATGLSYDNGGPVSGGAYGVTGAPAPAAVAKRAAADQPANPPPPHARDAPAPAPPPPPPARAHKPTPRALPRLRAPAKLRLSHGVVRLRLTCPVRCRFTVTISGAGHTIGRATASGRTVNLRIHLNARG